MSDKLKLLSSAIIFWGFVSSCSLRDSNPPLMNTEIICPNGGAILVKFARAKDLRAAIRVAHLNKKRLKTSENYTPIRLSDGRSFVLKGISPEVASTCDLRESKYGQVESTYIHHF